jgi:hypothetical protein
MLIGNSYEANNPFSYYSLYTATVKHKQLYSTSIKR